MNSVRQVPSKLGTILSRRAFRKHVKAVLAPTTAFPTVRTNSRKVPTRAFEKTCRAFAWTGSRPFRWIFVVKPGLRRQERELCLPSFCRKSHHCFCEILRLLLCLVVDRSCIQVPQCLFRDAFRVTTLFVPLIKFSRSSTLVERNKLDFNDAVCGECLL